ncbi:type I-B CRISPR-associated endonuclease Cas1b [Caminibacter pacificus]
MKTKYIFSAGEIKRKDNSIAFKNKDGWHYIPVRNIDELYFLNEVSLNSKFLSLCSKYEITLHFFGYFGNYIGTFLPKDKSVSGKIILAQAKAYETKREQIAKNIVLAISQNINFLLRHYQKHNKNVSEHIKKNKEFEKFLKKADSINKILFIEGQIWANFYESFSKFLPNEFILTKREKRPPKNMINALISFGNTLLYTKTLYEIYKTHLNESISFLHSTNERRYSLSLDLSESFKPIIVFRTIFKLINKKILKPQHFEKTLNYTILNNEGKKIFIEEFEKRLKETFIHKTLKKPVSYQYAIRLDGYKLIKSILYDREFVPFLLKDKK